MSEMTREQATKEAYEIADMPIDDTTLVELIDRIYDSFEKKEK